MVGPAGDFEDARRAEGRDLGWQRHFVEVNPLLSSLVDSDSLYAELVEIVEPRGPDIRTGVDEHAEGLSCVNLHGKKLAGKSTSEIFFVWREMSLLGVFCLIRSTLPSTLSRVCPSAS